MHGRAVGYVRVDKKDEGSDQYLAGWQIDVISEWAADNETDLIDWFFDIGVDDTESFGQRSAGAKLLDRVGRGDITHVVVGSLDVLGRGRTLLDAVHLLSERKKWLRVITVAPGPHEVAEPAGVDELDRIRTNGRKTPKAA